METNFDPDAFIRRIGKRLVGECQKVWGNQAAHASVAGVLPGPRFWGDIVDACELLVDHRVDNPLYDPGRGTRLPQRCRWPSVDHVAIYPHESGTAPHFLALPIMAEIDDERIGILVVRIAHRSDAWST